MRQADTRYTPKFFEGNAWTAQRSAEPVLRILFDLYSPKSVVDIGCGSGGWLAAAERLGAKEVRGYDGPWVDPTRYGSPTIDFTPIDLEKSDFSHDRRYDLAMSVEVAEHLTEAREDFIVDALCAGSDIVLFGAALPLQGGVNHVNEKPLSHWLAKFADRGYEAFDVIRPAIWDDDRIAHWFRQNTVLYVKRGSDVLDRAKLREMESHIWDVVHPSLYRKRVGQLREAQSSVRRLTAQHKRAAEAANAPAWRRVARRVSIVGLPAPIQPAARRAWDALSPAARHRSATRLRLIAGRQSAAGGTSTGPRPVRGDPARRGGADARRGTPSGTAHWSRPVTFGRSGYIDA